MDSISNTSIDTCSSKVVILQTIFYIEISKTGYKMGMSFEPRNNLGTFTKYCHLRTQYADNQLFTQLEVYDD